MVIAIDFDNTIVKQGLLTFRFRNISNPYERNIRGLKYQQQALLSGKCPKEASIIQARLNQTTKNYKQFLSDNNLTRLTLNERVTGYKAVSAYNEDLIKSGGLSNNAKNNVVVVSPTAKQLQSALKANDIAYNEVKTLVKKETSTEVIKNLGALDKTDGSCSSLALSYIGRKNGLNVTDFRGGISCDFFATPTNIKSIANLPDVKSWIIEEVNDFVGVQKLLKNVVEGKDYYLATGGHAAIIRQEKGILKFLELQKGLKENGFHILDTKVLKDRFDCVPVLFRNGKATQRSNILIDIDSLAKNNDFKILLGYINTSNS